MVRVGTRSSLRNVRERGARRLQGRAERKNILLLQRKLYAHLPAARQRAEEAQKPCHLQHSARLPNLHRNVREHPPALLPMEWWAFLLATPVQFVAGWRYYRGAWGALKARTANMDTLIVIGSTTAWAYSTFVVLFPQLAPSKDIYFDASALILALF